MTLLDFLAIDYLSASSWLAISIQAVSNDSDLTRPGHPNGGLVREITENFRKIQVGEIF